MWGAVIGDIVGSKYEFNNIHTKNFKLFNDLKSNETTFTDDTILTMAVIDIILNNNIDDKSKIISTFKKYGLKYPSSYGCSFGFWLHSDISDAYNSFGNGAAMRVSPIGMLAKDEDQLKKWCYAVTSVTHNHPEGLKGAEVTAMCIFYAWQGKSKEFIKKYAEKYYSLDFDYEELRQNYRFNETCQETVPQAIYCFLISKNFEDCLRTCISIGGDSDTLSAIACPIAEAYYKNIDQKIIDLCNKKLPNEFKKLLSKEYDANGWRE